MPAHPIIRDLMARGEEARDNVGADIVKRDTPRIGGSSGGFIALIVCLCLIIVVSCTAIFFLLRNRDPSDAERAARRQRRYAHQSVPSSSSYKYDPSSTPHKGWLSSLHSFFGKRSNASSTSNKSRKNGVLGRNPGSGWVQAGSGDEWDLDSDDEGASGDRRDTRSRGMVGVSHTPLSLSMSHAPTSQPIDPPFRPPRMESADSTSSVHFDSQAVTRLPVFHPTTTPSPLPNIPHLATPIILSPTSSADADSPKTPPDLLQDSHTRSFSPEPMSAGAQGQGHEEDGDKRQWSGQTDASARTFSGGTKFIESL